MPKMAPNPLWDLSYLIYPISLYLRYQLGLVSKVSVPVSCLWKVVPVVMDYVYNPIVLW